MAYNYSRADWDGLHDHLRDIPWNDLFKLSASCAASQFCEWVQVGIDLYISHCMYQVNPHSSPWFSATCAAAIVQRNHLFRLHQQNKSSESIVGFRQASNHCKRLLEAAKLAYANKTKKSIISHKLGSRNFFYDQITACCGKSAGLSHDELRTLSSAQIAVVYRTSSGRQLK